jgi:hypothetical protein
MMGYNESRWLRWVFCLGDRWADCLEWRWEEYERGDKTAAKLIYLTLNAASTEWRRSVHEWHAVRSSCSKIASQGPNKTRQSAKFQTVSGMRLWTTAIVWTEMELRRSIKGLSSAWEEVPVFISAEPPSAPVRLVAQPYARRHGISLAYWSKWRSAIRHLII